MMHPMDYVQPLLTLIASFAGTWFAAHFALRRFYREKVWERKTAAYTAIFEALYDMSLWFETQFNAEIPQPRGHGLHRLRQ
jgi:hypothetical protein